MNQIVYNNIKIENLIYEIRGKQVMLDSDLAKLYEILTGNLNKAVKRNIKRFPESFMFQLTDEEYDALRFQIGTSKIVLSYIRGYPSGKRLDETEDLEPEILTGEQIENLIQEGKFQQSVHVMAYLLALRILNA